MSDREAFDRLLGMNAAMPGLIEALAVECGDGASRADDGGGWLEVRLSRDEWSALGLLCVRLSGKTTEEHARAGT